MLIPRINGIRHHVDVDPDTPLLWVQGNTLCLTGTQCNCGITLNECLGWINRTMPITRCCISGKCLKSKGHIVESEEKPRGGEPSVWVLVSAVANPSIAATGQRVRKVPLWLA